MPGASASPARSGRRRTSLRPVGRPAKAAGPRRKAAKTAVKKGRGRKTAKKAAKKKKRAALGAPARPVVNRARSPMPSEAIQCKPLEVVVSDRGIERAIKMLKRKLASEGVLRELKMRRHYMKPSVKRRKKQAEAARRRRKRAKVEATVAAKP